MVVTLNVHMKSLTSIHGKSVDDYLTKHIVILVRLYESLYRRQLPPLTKVMVYWLKARTQQTRGNHKHIGKEIDNSDIYASQQFDEPFVHQTIAESCAFPLFLRHYSYPTLLSI